MVSPPNKTKTPFVPQEGCVETQQKKNGDDTSLKGGRDIIQESKYATMPTDHQLPKTCRTGKRRARAEAGRVYRFRALG
jgi:hypothetical protein